mgnify:CR=1 FL=1
MFSSVDFFIPPVSVSTYKGNKFVNRPVPAGEAREAKKEKFVRRKTW